MDNLVTVALNGICEDEAVSVLKSTKVQYESLVFGDTIFNVKSSDFPAVKEAFAKNQVVYYAYQKEDSLWKAW